ncbi:MAG: 3-hydroxybutyryl-CoA dehydrogenase [Cytophagales bacterium CG12_big_fil_rev_8_21_14_0_65_40_12]|nr:MAG: 3-hydroxybutyryl-CoA dehydrogenase [Cytophagales bacterium CG12_big_fil_rev_8_21_14_0_65_40_12]PIW04202.1 MAG: 3-hydroxybutyryl-CoA dehydrogenase [Cytophagales bacterium CG17_big_fil_post_rev_8_21_14_2_50_40_13]
MRLDEIKKIGVVGAGTMGQGIAQIAAMAGFEVVLYDLNSKSLKSARQNIVSNLQKGIEIGKLTVIEKEQALTKITFSEHFSDLIADVIIEAILEKLEIKKELFAKLEAQNKMETILASNTSSIPITRIAKDLKHPERFAGMHFFNPAHIMKLVEVISGASTSENTAKVIFELAKQLGKVPVLAKDAPGFIVNRVARNFYVEGLKVLEEQVSDVKGIDRLLESSGFKMGPFRLMDLIGVDTNFSVTTSMYNAFHQDPKFRPSRIQEQKVDAGHIGRKSGKGFYDYSN